jgi:hypothetical protein
MASAAGPGVCSTAAVPSDVSGVVVMSVALGVSVGVVVISAVFVCCGSTLSCGAAGAVSWETVRGADGCTGAAAWAVTGAAGDQRSPSEIGTTGVADWV